MARAIGLLASSAIRRWKRHACNPPAQVTAQHEQLLAAIGDGRPAEAGHIARQHALDTRTSTHRKGRRAWADRPERPDRRFASQRSKALRRQAEAGLWPTAPADAMGLLLAVAAYGPVRSQRRGSP